MQKSPLVNYPALDRVFEELGLDAILVLSPKNVFYFTSSPTARARVRSRSWPRSVGPVEPAALITRDTVTLVSASRDEAANEEESWVADVRYFREFRESQVDGLVDALGSARVARVGFEADYFTYRDVEALRAARPDLQLVACDKQLEWMRSMKTPTEISILERAADLLDEAILEGFDSARVGEDEWTIHNRIIEGAMRRGAEHCRGLLQAGSSNDLSFGGTGHKEFEPGDIIHIDYAAYFDGYPANLSRVGVVGEPSREQERIYADLLAVEKEVIDFMRPGVKGCDVFWYCRQALKERGYEHTAAIAGHNLGLGYHDRPMITEAEEMPLEENNIVALEPLIGWAYHIQDQVLVGHGGGILQSDSFDTSSLYVIG